VRDADVWHHGFVFRRRAALSSLNFCLIWPVRLVESKRESPYDTCTLLVMELYSGAAALSGRFTEGFLYRRSGCGGVMAVGETQNRPFQLSFNSSLKVNFQGARVTSNGGLIWCASWMNVWA